MRKETPEQREERLKKKKSYYNEHKEKWREYERLHREEINANVRERTKDPIRHEKLLQRKKKFYQQNKAKWRLYEKEHREDLNAKIRMRRKSNHETINIENRTQRTGLTVQQSRLESERTWKANNPEKMQTARKHWRQNHPEKTAEYNRKRAEKSPERIQIHNHARYLEKKECCEICGSTKQLEKHHPDYSEPDIVVTLCKECHTEVTIADQGRTRIIEQYKTKEVI
jgi:hypothetical protein